MSEGHRGGEFFTPTSIVKLIVEIIEPFHGKLTEEQLAIFDLLLKPRIELTKGEEKQVKSVAMKLLETLKREKLVLDWRKKHSRERR